MRLSKELRITLRVLIGAAVLASLSFGLQAATPQIGGGTCSTAMVSGTYFYLLGGTVVSGSRAVSYAELGKLVADGNGNVSGQSFASTGGTQTNNSLVGTYEIQSNCAGSIGLTVNSQFTETLTFQVVNNGQGVVLAISSSSAVVVGTAYRQTASASPIQCGNGSLSGAYGYVLTGIAPVSGGSLYSDAGQFVTNGNGNGSVASVANVGGSVSQVNATGTYTVASDCSGTAQVTSQNGTLDYRFALVRDGQVALFYGSDPGWTISGIFTPQFTAPSQSVVNGGSFQAGAAPGSLFSIFGTGLASNPASAQTLPLPGTLGSTQVLINGTPAPLVYVSDKQINAQMPIGTPIGRPISVTVTSAGATSITSSSMFPRRRPASSPTTVIKQSSRIKMVC